MNGVQVEPSAPAPAAPPPPSRRQAQLLDALRALRRELTESFDALRARVERGES